MNRAFTYLVVPITGCGIDPKFRDKDSGFRASEGFGFGDEGFGFKGLRM